MYAADYRQIARNKLTGRWPNSIAAAFIACLFGGLLTGGSFLPKIEIKLDELPNFSALLTGNRLLHLAGLLALLGLILGGAVEVGYARFLLKQQDGDNGRVKELFSYFDYLGTGFCQRFLRNLYTTLWAFLFVIPGIVAGYSYTMTPFILAENPELTASEAIARSKQMMYGHRWRLFCLDLSFFGWTLLCALTANLGYLVLNPYINAARAAFFRDLQARL